MRILDNHCHVAFPEPIEDTVKGFEKVIQELQISEIGLLSIPRTSHTGVELDILENLKMLYIKERLPIPVYAYAGFIYHSDDSNAYVQFAKDMLDMGVDGFKTLEQHPKNRKEIGKGLNDASFDDFFDYIGKKKIPMVCHVGDPRCNWNLNTATESAKMMGRVYDSSFPSLDELYGEMDELFRKHPDVPIVLAHFYFKSDDYDGLVKLMETYPNIYLDFTPGAEMFIGFSKNIEIWREFFLRYSKRLIFGSDLYGAGYGVARHQLVRQFLETSESFDLMQRGDIVTPVNLPEEVLADIYSGNAKRLLGESPKTVNREKVYGYCVDIAENHLEELNDIAKENLQTFLKFWGEKPND